MYHIIIIIQIHVYMHVVTLCCSLIIIGKFSSDLYMCSLYTQYIVSLTIHFVNHCPPPSLQDALSQHCPQSTWTSCTLHPLRAGDWPQSASTGYEGECVHVQSVYFCVRLTISSYLGFICSYIVVWQCTFIAFHSKVFLFTKVTLYFSGR